MKLLHLAFAGLDQRGVHRKLGEQARALRAIGVDVESVVVADRRVVADGNTSGIIDDSTRLIDVPGGGFGPVSRATAVDALLRVMSTSAPDLVYLRYPIYDAEIQRMVESAPPVVLELQTIFANEVSSVAAAQEAEWAARILPGIAGLVAVTQEILDYEQQRAGWNIPGLVMPNGADPRTIPFIEPALPTDRVNLLCVASYYPWHGTDRLIVGMAMEPEVSDVHLHLVGDGPTVPSLKALVREASLESRVHFHGAIPMSDLDPFYRMAHVAIGSLAPHRVGLRELAALKHREYAFRGLPLVIAGADADFTRALPWVRHVAADDSPVSPRLLRALGMGWTAPVRRRQIRPWAEATVAWEPKVRTLVNFLESSIVATR